MSQSFPGFPADTFAFLRDLEHHNNRPWFEANRARYETAWKSPALDLITALQDPMAQLDPPLKAEARINGSLRRINRDVRFSKDKSPYQTQLYLIFWSGSHPNRSPGFHFVLQPDAIGYGAGVFGLSPAELAAYRGRIMDADQRAGLLQAVEQAKAVGCDFDEPDLKRLPRGFETDENWEHLLRRKAFILRNQNPLAVPDWITSTRCVPHILKIAQSLMPLLFWLQGDPAPGRG